MFQDDGSRIKAGGIGIVLLVFLLALALPSSAALKIKVTTDAAGLKVSPDAGANTLVRLPLNTVLEAEAKQGEWYKILFEISPGNRVVAYLHEQLAAPVDEPTAPLDKSAPEKEKPASAKEPTAKDVPMKEAANAAVRTQAELTAEIEVQLDRCRTLIRQSGGADEALNLLSPLTARTLRVVDHARQEQISTEVFFLKGLAYAFKNDEVSARKEFRNMFEVSDAEARKLTRNVFDARITGLLKLAEDEFMGLAMEYAIEIVSDPPGARVKADGRDLGPAPVVYKTQTPRVLIELEKDGYKPVREDADLTQPSSRKSYRLAPAFFNLAVRSTPPGAKIFLDGKDTGSVTDGELLRLSPGPHQVRLVKEFYGEAQARLELAEGSPDSVELVLFVSSYAPHGVWGGLGSPFFKNPAAIAADREDRIIVVDESPVKLKIFNRLGEVTGGGAQMALGLTDLVKPAGVAAGPDTIYVADAESHVILKLDPTGRVQAKWGKFGSDQDGLNTPLGLALDGEGNLYVADSGNGRVKKYGPGGDVLASWGTAGSENGQFLSPRAVAVNAKGEVFVLDSRQVQKLSPKGEWLASWGRPGSGDGEFRNAMGLCVDAAGSVYVADTGNHRIQKFEPSGRSICSWGSNGKDSGLFDLPSGVVVDAGGIVYVVDRNNQRIQLFTAGPGALGGAEPLDGGTRGRPDRPLSRPTR